MAIQTQMLRDSFKAVSHKGDELVATFYDTLFSRYPSVRPLFDATRMPEQKTKLLRSLAIIVRHVDNPDYLMPYLQGLGKMHIAYGTKPEHYAAVGECLLHARKTTAGPLWTPPLEKAWAEAYGVVADGMKKGAAA